MALSNRKKNGIGCFVLAALLAVVAIRNTFFVEELAVNDETGLGVSRMVGAFLPAILVLALGAWLFQDPKPKSK